MNDIDVISCIRWWTNAWQLVDKQIVMAANPTEAAQTAFRDSESQYLVWDVTNEPIRHPSDLLEVEGCGILFSIIQHGLFILLREREVRSCHQSQRRRLWLEAMLWREWLWVKLKEGPSNRRLYFHTEILTCRFDNPYQRLWRIQSSNQVNRSHWQVRLHIYDWFGGIYPFKSSIRLSKPFLKTWNFRSSWLTIWMEVHENAWKQTGINRNNL